jgi:hypothetical protein
MALVVSDAPIGGLLYAAYVSQTFIVTETVTTGQPPAALEVVVKNEGVTLETLYYEAIEVTSSAGTDTCTFKFDIREVVQQLFVPRDLLPIYGGGGGSGFQAVYGSPNVAFIECELTPWKPNASGLLERDAGSTENTLGYRVINAVRVEEEEPAMQEFFQSTNRRFLTSKPLRGYTDLFSNEFLYMYNRDDVEMSWIVSFRQNTGIFSGFLRSWGRVLPTDDENKILRLGVGGLNILNMAWDEEHIIGGGTDMGLENQDIDYYEVHGAAVGSTDAITEVRRYYVKWETTICITYRIHFLNRFGVWDFFPVTSQPGDNLQLVDDPYEKKLPDDFIFGSSPITRSHVRMRGQVRGDKGFEVEVAGFSDKQAVWLQELAMSPLAFIEKEPADQPGAFTRFYPIVIQTDDFDISERKFTFTVIYSKQRFSQRV